MCIRDSFKDDIKNYQPINEQEIQDQKVIIQLIEQSPHILTRDNSVAPVSYTHLTISWSC